MTLVFAADWLLQPVPGADPETFRSLDTQIDDLSGRVYGDLPSRVRRIACNLLHYGSGSLEEAAEVLSVHPRTLDRNLQRFGTTYRQLRDECKQALASHLLVETELSIPEMPTDSTMPASLPFPERLAAGTAPPPQHGVRADGRP